MSVVPMLHLLLLLVSGCVSVSLDVDDNSTFTTSHVDTTTETIESESKTASLQSNLLSLRLSESLDNNATTVVMPEAATKTVLTNAGSMYQVPSTVVVKDVNASSQKTTTDLKIDVIPYTATTVKEETKAGNLTDKPTIGYNTAEVTTASVPITSPAMKTQGYGSSFGTNMSTEANKGMTTSTGMKATTTQHNASSAGNSTTTAGSKTTSGNTAATTTAPKKSGGSSLSVSVLLSLAPSVLSLVLKYN